MIPEGVSIRHPDKLYIGGEWVEPKSGKQLEVVNPNSEEVVVRVAEAGVADMDRAVAAARKAFDEGPWPTTPPAERGRMVRELAERLKARTGELAKAWTAQIGGLPGMAEGVVMNGNITLDAIAGLGESFEWTSKKKGQMVDTVIIAREPVGVVAAIAPWNAPYMIMISPSIAS